MSSQSDACRANALHCLEVANKTRSSEDSCEFVNFAEAWQRLANEIECAERLIALIDQLAADGSQRPATSEGSNEAAEQHNGSAHPIRELTTAIVSISSRFLADHLHFNQQVTTRATRA